MPQERSEINRSEAEKTVFDNLGLDTDTLDDLDSERTLDSNEDDLDLNEGRVTHTDDDRLDDLRIDPNEQQQQDDQVQPVNFGDFELKADRQGNIVDPQGKIVARAGLPARMYTGGFKHGKSQADNVARAYHDVAGKLDRAVQIGIALHDENTQLKTNPAQSTTETARKLGLDTNEELDALQLAAAVKADPVSALKTILTRAAARGIDLTQLGAGLNNQFDPKAFMELVRNEIGQVAQPIKDEAIRRKQQADAEAQQGRATQENESKVRQYFSENREMVQYAPVFLEAVKRFPQMSLGEIGARIQLNLLRQRGNPQNQRRSLPNGRGGPAQGQQDQVAPVSTSYDDIIRGALNEAGVK